MHHVEPGLLSLVDHFAAAQCAAYLLPISSNWTCWRARLSNSQWNPTRIHTTTTFIFIDSVLCPVFSTLTLSKRQKTKEKKRTNAPLVSSIERTNKRKTMQEMCRFLFTREQDAKRCEQIKHIYKLQIYIAQYGNGERERDGHASAP